MTSRDTVRLAFSRLAGCVNGTVADIRRLSPRSTRGNYGILDTSGNQGNAGHTPSPSSVSSEDEEDGGCDPFIPRRMWYWETNKEKEMGDK